MTREEVLKLSLSKIMQVDKLLLELPTGYGKTFISLSTCFHFLKKKRKKNYTILILVAEIAHIDNWKNEFIKWKFPLDKVEFACYASIQNYIDKSFTVVIADEAHNATSDIRSNSLNRIKFEKIILATATITKEHLINLGRLSRNLYTIKVELSTAIDNGTLPTPKVVLVPIPLDVIHSNYIYELFPKRKKEVTISYSDMNKYIFNKKFKEYKFNIKCTAKQYYELISKQIDDLKNKFNSTRNISIKNYWMQLSTVRKRWLGEYKTVALKKLLSELDDRFICFCSSIQQAESINIDHSIHSKKNKPLELLNDFNNKIINSLLAIKMLREGQNLVDTKYGIITQLDSKELSAIQMMGRVLRHTEPVLYVLYVPETRDEDYLGNTVLKIIPKDYISLQKVYD